ncbi:MAG TPA: AcvB/VirJ family lysyl-phosphatidylglycerol hydrolase [Gemmatimonadaceae bacterium]|nr:AcvB/VirJ family lysyl-phosphatidylglycerol hydrolase [Gemmatimonadaceae bacterium]
MRIHIKTIGVALAASVAMTVQAAAQRPASVRDLPLIEAPAAANGSTLAIMLSGDGGWADIDKQIAAELSRNGVAVAGLDTRAYLRGRNRDADQLARDLARIADAYAAQWNRRDLAIVGYSRGADLAPFAINRLPAEVRSRVRLVALIGLARAANWHFHWIDVVKDVSRPDDVPTQPEVERLGDVPTLCIYGADEHESGCLDVPPAVHRIVRPGGHHLDGKFALVADSILAALR